MTTYYTEEQALEGSIQYFNGNEKAAKIWLSKYCLKDNDGNIYEQNPDDTLWRIAREIARIEENKFKKPLSEKEVYEYIKDFKYICPQGSPLFSIGNQYQYVSTSNCFVVESPNDSYSGIMRSDEQLAQISKRRGGVGVDISTLRPRNMPVNNAAMTTTGAVSFMPRYSNTINEVGQNGRRGALMLTISVHHPDILDFIKIKADEKSVTGANISIRLSNEFLIAVTEDTDYELRWPIDSKSPKVSQKISARKVWKEIIHYAWLRAEPGLLFWDRIISESPADCYEKFGFKTISTNPCSELPLSKFDSCRLLILNTFSYVENPFTNNAKFDYKKFYNHCKIAQRFMDDIVDIELECIDRILIKVNKDKFDYDYNRVERELWQNVRKACESGRRTGTGLTAIGDTIAALGLKYSSDESIDEIEKIYKTLKHACYESSIDMAEEIGPFSVFDYKLEKNNPFLNRMYEERPDLLERTKKFGRRNIALLTTAPVGTLSQLMEIGPYFETTSGIEPLYTCEEYTRRKKVNHNEKAKVDFVDSLGQEWTEFSVRHSGIQLFCDINPGKNVEDSPYYGSSANEINWVQRVKLQARANLHVDHAISSTINLPNNVKEEEVAKIYESAWKAGVKGLTVYRDGCRSGVLVTKTEEKQKINKTDAPKRPKDLDAEIHTFKIGGKDYTAFVGLLEGEPYEILVKTDTYISRSTKVGTVRKVKRGHYAAIMEGEVIVDSITEGMSHEEEALTRMVSTALRHGADIHYIVHQLEKTKGDMISFAKCLSRALKKYIKDGSKVSGETCNRCESNSLVRQEGCITCQNCGWSKCG